MKAEDEPDRTRTRFILHPSSFEAPICAASSGTTTSTCWKTAPRFSRGTRTPSSTRFHLEWPTGDAGSERPGAALGPGFAARR